MVKVESEYGTTFMEVVDGMAVISGRSEELDSITEDSIIDNEVLHMDLSVREHLGLVGIQGSDVELVANP